MEFLLIAAAGVLVGIGVIILILSKPESLDNSGVVNRVIAKGFSQEEENILSGTHYYMSYAKYNFFLIVVVFSIVLLGLLMLSNELFILAVVVYILFYPRRKVGIIKMPFFHICDMLRKRDGAMKDDELLEILSLLKNIMIQLRHNSLGADYIIEYLMGNAELTKPAFYKMLNLLRLGRVDEAQKAFEAEIGTPLAVDAGRLLIQIDEVESAILEQALISIERQIREVGNTHKKTTNERYSDLILVPVIFTAMMVFLNFLVVTFVSTLVDATSIFSNL